MDSMGIVTEQGDLGLGFNECTEEEAATVSAHLESQEENGNDK